jgi:hypothetical protein
MTALALVPRPAKRSAALRRAPRDARFPLQKATEWEIPAAIERTLLPINRGT